MCVCVCVHFFSLAIYIKLLQCEVRRSSELSNPQPAVVAAKSLGFSKQTELCQDFHHMSFLVVGAKREKYFR